jgi:hypothetical protein
MKCQNKWSIYSMKQGKKPKKECLGMAKNLEIRYTGNNMFIICKFSAYYISHRCPIINSNII